MLQFYLVFYTFDFDKVDELKYLLESSSRLSDICSHPDLECDWFLSAAARKKFVFSDQCIVISEARYLVWYVEDFLQEHPDLVKFNVPIEFVDTVYEEHLSSILRTSELVFADDFHAILGHFID